MSVQARFDSMYIPVTESGCWLWIGDTTSCRGYGRMRVDGKSQRVNRVSWTLHRGEIPEGLCVCHKCDTPECVNPDHLFLGTSQENTADRDAKGRQRPGRTGAHKPPKHSGHHQAKLSEVQVEQIRSMATLGEISQREIAARFGISQANVSFIKTGTTWYPERRTRGES